MDNTLNYDTVIENINKGIPFTLSRWGDGEFNCLFGKSGHNCDKHKYFPSLSKRLQEILKSSPKYPIGVGPMAHKVHKEKIHQTIDKYNLKTFDISFIHTASKEDRLNELFDALKGRNVSYVAPKRLENLSQIQFDHIVIPDENCWNSYKETLNTLKQKKNNIILYSASMMSNVLIDDMYSDQITQIDCGSVFEPYIGNSNRSYHNSIIERLCT